MSAAIFHLTRQAVSLHLRALKIQPMQRGAAQSLMMVAANTNRRSLTLLSYGVAAQHNSEGTPPGHSKVREIVQDFQTDRTVNVQRKCDEKEIQAVKESTDIQIQSLMSEIKNLNEWKNESKWILAEKEKEIERLKEREEQCRKEIDEIKEAKHQLELKIERTEADLRSQIQILKERIKYAEQQAKGQMGLKFSNGGLTAFLENVGPITIIFVTVLICGTAFGIVHLITYTK